MFCLIDIIKQYQIHPTTTSILHTRTREHPTASSHSGVIRIFRDNSQGLSYPSQSLNSSWLPDYHYSRLYTLSELVTCYTTELPTNQTTHRVLCINSLSLYLNLNNNSFIRARTQSIGCPQRCYII